MDIIGQLDKYLKPLNEMATVCSRKDGYAMIIRLYSDDHEPVHCHVLDLNKKLLAKILITKDRPRTEANLRYLKPDKFGELNPTFRARVVLGANEKRDGMYNGTYMRHLWRSIHEND